MIVNSVELMNFRNYKRETFQFSDRTNILYGNNAQGKTNVLEAIYLASTSKSYKKSKDNEMIMIGEDQAHIRMMVTKKDNMPHKIDIHLKKSKSKGIAIDSLPIKNSSEILGYSNIIFFSPEDLSIVYGGPEARRRFLDIEICRIDKIYLDCLIKYNHTLKQRNELLKQIDNNKSLLDTLDIWNNKLVEYGKVIIEKRDEFINRIDSSVNEIYGSITGNKEYIKLTYEPNVYPQDFSRNLIMNEDKDLYKKTTSIGPQRDDIKISSQDKDLRKYGSRGQQRTAALSLKLTEIKVLEEIIGEKPVLLLDDVLSELDRDRQTYLLKHIRGMQTIITCTGLEEFVKNGLNIEKKFEIKEGSIINQDS